MKALAFGLLLLSGPALADVMIHDNKQTVTVDCAKDKAVHVHGNNATITLKGTCKSIMIAGNDATVTGSVSDVSVPGNNNKLTLDATQSISVTGNDNTLTYKKSIDAKKKVDVSVLGNKNKISQAK